LKNAEITHGTWGQWPSVKLATEAVELEVVGEVGARIVSLRDKRRNREWLVQGEPPEELQQMAWAEESAPFGSRESFGWDECLPTTSICADPMAPDGPDLRDHGDQWGRGAYLSLDHDAGVVVHTWSVPRWGYRLSRRLSFEDEQTLLVEYVLVSLANEPLPLTWAQHALLRLEAGSIFDLPGVHRVTRSFQLGIDLPEELEWPVATTTDGRHVDLSRMQPDAGWAAVVYAQPAEGVCAVAPDSARLDLDWDRDFAPLLRVWLGHGGWPPGGPPNVQVALEPVTSADDDLVSAIEKGRANTLAPGEESRWWARLRLS
jgi:galactose mutarotase-like enzyme